MTAVSAPCSSPETSILPTSPDMSRIGCRTSSQPLLGQQHFTRILKVKQDGRDPLKLKVTMAIFSDAIAFSLRLLASRTSFMMIMVL